MIKINQFYTENCLNTMARMPNNFIDLTVTSPPYDNLRTYNGYEFEFEGIAKELYRVTKVGGVVVWIVGDQTINGSETLTSFKQAIYFKEQCGFNVYDTMIYRKDGIQYPDINRYYQCFEYMFVLTKGKIKTVNLINDRKNLQYGNKISGGYRQRDGSLHVSSGEKKKRKVKYIGTRFNIWDYNTGFMKSTKDKVAFDHPAIFPEQLAADHIRSWSNEGDLIYDPMVGSGTTVKMAIKLKRNWIASEISAKYIKIAKKRIKSLLLQKTLF